MRGLLIRPGYTGVASEYKWCIVIPFKPFVYFRSTGSDITRKCRRENLFGRIISDEVLFTKLNAGGLDSVKKESANMNT